MGYGMDMDVGVRICMYVDVCVCLYVYKSCVVPTQVLCCLNTNTKLQSKIRALEKTNTEKAKHKTRQLLPHLGKGYLIIFEAIKRP